MRNRESDLAFAGSNLSGPAGNAPYSHEMRPSLIGSVALHFIILLLVIFGLPFWHKPPMEFPDPIAVTMVDPSDLARTTHVAEPLPKPEPVKVEEKQHEPPKPPPPPPTPPKVEAEPVPALKPVVEQKTQMPQLEALPDLAKPAQIKPPPPKPQPAQPPKETEQKKAQEDQQFDALLKNLSKPVPKTEQTDQKTADKKPPSQEAAQQATLSEQMTGDEMGKVRQQLGACWIVAAGARDAQDLVVQVAAVFNADRTLQSAKLVDDGRYNSDPFYRAAADSALRALRNPACNPLLLPPDKYNAWHIMTISFNPKTMFGP